MSANTTLSAKEKAILERALSEKAKRAQYMKKYNTREDVKAKRRAYGKQRREEEKQVLLKAKEAGLL